MVDREDGSDDERDERLVDERNVLGEYLRARPAEPQLHVFLGLFGRTLHAGGTATVGAQEIAFVLERGTRDTGIRILGDLERRELRRDAHHTRGGTDIPTEGLPLVDKADADGDAEDCKPVNRDESRRVRNTDFVHRPPRHNEGKRSQRQDGDRQAEHELLPRVHRKMPLEAKLLCEPNDGPQWTEVTPDSAEKHEAEKHNWGPPKAEERDVPEVRPRVRRADRGLIDRVEENRDRDQVDGMLDVLIREYEPNQLVPGDGDAALRRVLVARGSIRPLVLCCHHWLLAPIRVLVFWRNRRKLGVLKELIGEPGKAIHHPLGQCWTNLGEQSSRISRVRKYKRDPVAIIPLFRD